MLCVVAALCGATAQGQTGRERAQRRVEALSTQTLLSAPIAQLVDPARQRLAEALVARQRPLFFVSAVAQIAILLWLWRSGRAARLRDVMRRRIRNVHALRAAYVWVLAMIVALAALPGTIVSYRYGLAIGISTQSPAEWLGQAASAAIVNAILAAIVFTVLLALAERTRLWYVYGAAFLVVFVLLAIAAEPVALAPWLRHYQPLPNSALATRLQGIEHKAGIDVPIIVENVGEGSRASVARARGIGPTQRIVITDTLLRDATPDELGFAVAREAAHVADGDNWKFALYATLWLIVAAAIAVIVADRIGFRRDDDPLARIALLGAFLGIAILVLLPAVNAYSRRLEARADRHALNLTSDPAAAVRTLIRIADVNLLPVCPSPLVRRYFLTYPPVGSRIAALRGAGDPCP